MGPSTKTLAHFCACTCPSLYFRTEATLDPQFCRSRAALDVSAELYTRLCFLPWSCISPAPSCQTSPATWKVRCFSDPGCWPGKRRTDKTILSPFIHSLYILVPGLRVNADAMAASLKSWLWMLFMFLHLRCDGKSLSYILAYRVLLHRTRCSPVFKQTFYS